MIITDIINDIVIIMIKITILISTLFQCKFPAQGEVGVATT